MSLPISLADLKGRSKVIEVVASFCGLSETIVTEYNEPNYSVTAFEFWVSSRKTHLSETVKVVLELVLKLYSSY